MSLTLTLNKLHKMSWNLKNCQPYRVFQTDKKPKVFSFLNREELQQVNGALPMFKHIIKQLFNTNHENTLKKFMRQHKCVNCPMLSTQEKQ